MMERAKDLSLSKSKLRERKAPGLDLLKMPRHDFELEKAVLGALLLEKTFFKYRWRNVVSRFIL